MKIKKILLMLVLVAATVASIFYFYNFKINTVSSSNVMKIVSVKPFNSVQHCKDTSCMEIGPHNLKILLTGPVLVTGEYSFVDSAIGFSGYCMKNFDNKFLGKLPYGISGENVKMFCFRNENFAEGKLGKERKIVSVKIDNFELNSYPSEVMNWADLVNVR